MRNLRTSKHISNTPPKSTILRRRMESTPLPMIVRKKCLDKIKTNIHHKKHITYNSFVNNLISFNIVALLKIVDVSQDYTLFNGTLYHPRSRPSSVRFRPHQRIPTTSLLRFHPPQLEYQGLQRGYDGKTDISSLR